MSFQQARDIILSERGQHFDPVVVDAFVSAFDDCVAIARSYPENG
jgi:response regulator RpfG family c-di-GMP phosphodiesterase